MTSLMFRCPTAEINTNAWIAEELTERLGDNDYVSVACLACQRVHLINPRTETVLGTRKS